MTHYMFIIDPRTQKIMGEPNRYNTAVLSVILGVDYHLETVSLLRLCGLLG
jgi:hypothetical protein